LSLLSSSDREFQRQSLLPNEHLGYLPPVKLLKDFIPQHNCIDEVLQLKEGQQCLSKLEYILEGCKDWFESLKSKKNHNPLGLSDNEVMALALYTYDIGLQGGREDNFYFQLNKVLQERNQTTMMKWRGYLYFLQRALSHFPDQKMTVYRGIPEYDIFEKEYIGGRKIHWSGFSSTTSTLEKAKNFVGASGVVLCIKILGGKCIKDYSIFPSEDEILLSPNMAFIVTQELYLKDSHYYLDLTQQLPGKTFVF